MGAMNAQVRQEAAEWLIELQLDMPDATTRQRFGEWLRVSPEHVRAYLELVALWEDARQYDSARQLDVEALIDRARQESNLVDLKPSHAIPPLHSRRVHRNRFVATVAAIVALIA